jgi:hypothetical protein
MLVKINFYKPTFNESEISIIETLLDSFDVFTDDDIIPPDVYTIDDKQIEVSCHIRRTSATEFEILLPLEDLENGEIKDSIFARIKRDRLTCEISILEKNVCHIDFLQTEITDQIGKSLAVILKKYPTSKPFLFPDIIYQFGTIKVVFSQKLARRPWHNCSRQGVVYFPDKFEVLGNEDIYINVSGTIGVVYVYSNDDIINFKKSTQRKDPIICKVQSTNAPLESLLKSTQEELQTLNAVYPKAGKGIIAFNDEKTYTFFFMRKFPGVRLSEYLLHHKMRSLLQAVTIMKLCAQAAMKFSNKNFIHCDIKPENILIKAENPLEIFLIDAGSATKVNKTVTYINGVTVGYRAPELHNLLVDPGRKNATLLTTAIDVFSLLGVYLGILGDKEALEKKIDSDRNGGSCEIYPISNKLFFTITDTDNRPIIDELKALLIAMNSRDPANRIFLNMVYNKLFKLEETLQSIQIHNQGLRQCYVTS